MTPTVGRIVHYYFIAKDCTPETLPWGPFPAIVTSSGSTDEDPDIILYVLIDPLPYFVSVTKDPGVREDMNKLYNPEPVDQYQWWEWPPRAAE